MAQLQFEKIGIIELSKDKQLGVSKGSARTTNRLHLIEKSLYTEIKTLFLQGKRSNEKEHDG